MKRENKKVEKLCSFYVSNWHLTTMLLPYINRKIDENVKIITILENSIEENIKILVEKLNLKNKEKILNIHWDNKNTIKYSDIEEMLSQEIKEKTGNIILINGCKDYMEQNNENVEKWFKKSALSLLKIINFYEVAAFNSNIIDILDKHDRVFNTSGEREIEEVFEGYKRGSNKIETEAVGE